MKILLSTLLILSSLATIAQNKSIQPGSKEYDEMKAKGKLEQPPQAPAQKN